MRPPPSGLMVLTWDSVSAEDVSGGSPPAGPGAAGLPGNSQPYGLEISAPPPGGDGSASQQ